MNSSILFDGWPNIIRVLIVGSFAYIALVIVLRVTGKRTLSKMNAFDLVITVALGSALSSTMLSKSTALAEGIAGLSLLVVMQLIVTWLSVRSVQFKLLIKAEPRLLVHRGTLLRDAMRIERITEDEIMAAMRSSGNRDLGHHSVVLETDGSLSVYSEASTPR